MKKILALMITFSLIYMCTITSGMRILKNNDEIKCCSVSPSDSSSITNEFSQLPSIFSKYITDSNQNDITEITLPWIDKQSDILEWWIRIEYNNELFEKKVPVNISDFKDKFLKHPEYGERVSFNVDEDAENDIEVIAGFYWSVIKDVDGNDVKSLEKRIRVRQLETGDYVQDQDGDMQVWSELHVNYGLIKKEVHSFSLIEVMQNRLQQFSNLSVRFNQFKNRLSSFQELLSCFPIDYYHPVSAADSDHFVLGAGYRSPLGEDIPRYAEKRFSFARSELFGPSIFQHQMDPGSSKGKGVFEVLYGFSAYREGSTSPSYDIAFSIEFNPAVSLRTKYIPSGGQLYYYFDENSQQNSETAITFTSNILSGIAEDIELTLVFDEINGALGKTGRWMKFDTEIIGDHELLGGKFEYEASHIFDVGVIVNSPLFEEKIELIHIPKQVDISWDLDFSVMTTPLFHAHAEGFINLSMSSSLGRINVFFPKTDDELEDQIFIDVPQGLPADIRIDAATTLHVDLSDLQNSANYVYGDIQHTCSDDIDCIRAFLPDESTPIIKVTEIPADSEVRGRLHWNKLEGYAEMWRGSLGPDDPVEINLEYKEFSIHDVLTIRNGHIKTRFRLSENGHFFFDTTEGIFGNDLTVSNTVSGDGLSLFVHEISADDLQADWNIDTSGDSLKINDLHLGGMIDVMNGLILNLQYQGKSTSLNMDWYIGQTGSFQVQLDQEDDLTIDFNDFALNSTDFDFGGSITISDTVKFDMSWDLKQGLGSDQGSIDPGYFAVNKYNDDAILKDLSFYVTYQDQYGISITLSNLQFYLNLEWWKGDRLLPYIWLDYEVSADDFDIDLLWTNQNGETKWYDHVEEW
ncbi:MAG: hypothetical protein KGY50_00445 [Candidatus Thermoplasmatota archaeon]|nr:hypothetical protein [Candidatus Thermoplasmatota archaeon]